MPNYFWTWALAPPEAWNFEPAQNLPMKVFLEAVQSASGIFISGGTQMRLPATIGGTPLEAEILAAYQTRRYHCRDQRRCGGDAQSNDRLWQKRTNSA